MTGLDDDVFDSQEHMQPGGLHHRPAAGAEGVLLSMFGSLDDAVVIALSNRSKRPTVAVGETALYNDSATQSKITIKANGDVEVTLSASAVLKLGAANQSFLRGEAFNTYLDAVIAATSTAINGVPTAGPGLKTAFDNAILAAAPLKAAALSAKIKGE